jgi:hypothetical protein
VTSPPYSLPWYLSALEETLEAFGSDIWPEGFEANWPAVETLMRYASEQGLIDRLFKPICAQYADRVPHLIQDKNRPCPNS